VKVHDFFHISLLKIYVQNLDHVIDWSVLQVELEESSGKTSMHVALEEAHALESSNKAS